MLDFDVAVVGAGPAGATVARELALSGVRTALVERERLPRYKSCAGGIPIRTARLLPFPIDRVVEDEISGINVSYLGRSRFEQHDDRPFALMVMRDRFDQLLAERAAECGAELMDGVTVRTVERQQAGFTLRTATGSLSAALVVGADGANSSVARGTGLGAGLAEASALEAEIRAPLAVLARWRGMVNVDLGYRPSGYGWVFPKQSLLSVGLVLPRERSRELRRLLATYLGRLALQHAPIERIVGHKVLFRRGHETIATSRSLLVGDAAGLVDEFTEEGIYYAIRSGELAAAVIRRRLSGTASGLDAYQRLVDRELMPELRAARTIARLYYGALLCAPAAMLLVSRHLRYLWQAFFRVQRGESSYAAELQRARAVAPLGHLLLSTGSAAR